MRTRDFGRVWGGQEVAFEPQHGLQQAIRQVLLDGVFNDHIAIDFEVIALGGGECGKGPDEFAVRHARKYKRGKRECQRGSK